MKLKQEPLTAEDGKLIENQLTATLAIVTGLRTYLEQAGKLQASDRNRFKGAEIALHAIRVKAMISRASEMTKRINQAKPGKL